MVPSNFTLPSWDNVAIEENGWSFKQQGIVENNVKVNLGKKVITFDMTKNTHHVHNQMSNEKSRKKKMWQTLLDSQSTCNDVINISLVQNMHVGGWTLKLQTQAGYFRTTQIGDMRGVGTAWRYLEGVANMLPQFRVTFLSKRMMSCNAAKLNKTGNIKHLCYEVTTCKGKHCRLLPTPEGLHAFTVPNDKADSTHRDNVPCNDTAFGNSM